MPQGSWRAGLVGVCTERATRTSKASSCNAGWSAPSFAASRNGDFEALLEVLDPDATLRAGVTPSGDPIVTTGAAQIARRAQAGAAARGRWSEVMLIDGAAGIVVAPFGEVRLAMTFELAADRIRHIEILTEPDRLAALELRLVN